MLILTLSVFLFPMFVHLLPTPLTLICNKQQEVKRKVYSCYFKDCFPWFSCEGVEATKTGKAN